MDTIPLILNILLVASVTPVFVLWTYTRKLLQENKLKKRDVLRSLGVPEGAKRTLVGFFHPYWSSSVLAFPLGTRYQYRVKYDSNAGGGGERVLWAAVALLQRTSPDLISVVYSGDGDAGKDKIIEKVKTGFNITLDPNSLHFVFLKSRHLVEDSSWPRFTLLGQSVGSMVLAWEALTGLMPDIYIDTMGYAFTMNIVNWLSRGRVPVGAYVHYPTISTEMLARVRSRKRWHTNDDAISSSSLLSSAKLLYYRIFMYHYSLALRRASFLMVNSSWTKSHVDAILNHHDTPLDIIHSLLSIPALPFSLLLTSNPRHEAPKSAGIVYPPCETDELTGFPLEGRERVILSLAQFRPEKDHAAQLESFAELVKQHSEYCSNDSSKPVKLVLVGGVRNEGDASRVESLRSLAKDLNIQDSTEFIVNAPYTAVLSWLSRSSIGLSTMVDEHFGINVVEYMAAGLIPVTHASGGPLNDIVVPYKGEPTGFHATDPQTFASALHTVLSLTPTEELAMRGRARRWAVERFSRQGFEEAWESTGWRNWLPQS